MDKLTNESIETVVDIIEFIEEMSKTLNLPVSVTLQIVLKTIQKLSSMPSTEVEDFMKWTKQ